jgi:hypothetical protein
MVCCIGEFSTQAATHDKILFSNAEKQIIIDAMKHDSDGSLGKEVCYDYAYSYDYTMTILYYDYTIL